MKQVLQDLKTGQIVVLETPDVIPAPGRVLVRVQASVLSAGTESASIAKSRRSLLRTVRDKPELIWRGFEELREHGLAGVRARLASKFEGFTELGYSCCGLVVHGADECAPPGTLVACAGAGLANHAEFVSVPRLLTAVVPQGVSVETASYTTLGAIALQGIRQAQLQLGECVAVIGLGLVGLLAVQLIRANGCRVLGVDPSSNALRRGQSAGCELVAEPSRSVEAALEFSSGVGVDAVIICAASVESSPVQLAGKIARSRGRVVMVGATGMELPREEYFSKELSFVLSRSYGPGRYDSTYEDQGLDYPLDYVRFTEQRNMRTFLELAKNGNVDSNIITTHRFPLEEAPEAYQLLMEPGTDRAGILLTYPTSPSQPSAFAIPLASPKPERKGLMGVALVGAGSYAQSLLLPLLQKRSDVVLRSVASRNGVHALQVAKRFGFETASTRLQEVLDDPDIHVVFITTRHDTHAEFTCAALRAGKHVWVEKPLALSISQLSEVCKALSAQPSCRLVIGFNRPFSRSARWLFERMSPTRARMMLYRVNAGLVPANSWIHDPAIGGGRLLGEGCHFLDFLRHAAGANAQSVSTDSPSNGRADQLSTSNFAITVRFANYAIGQVLYSSQGDPGMPKEYFECFGGDLCGSISDFCEADFFHQKRRSHLSRHRQDKGQGALIEAFFNSLRTAAPAPVTPEDILESSLLTLAAQQSLISRTVVPIEDLRRQLS